MFAWQNQQSSINNWKKTFLSQQIFNWKNSVFLREEKGWIFFEVATPLSKRRRYLIIEIFGFLLKNSISLLDTRKWFQRECKTDWVLSVPLKRFTSIQENVKNHVSRGLKFTNLICYSRNQSWSWTICHCRRRVLDEARATEVEGITLQCDLSSSEMQQKSPNHKTALYVTRLTDSTNTACQIFVIKFLYQLDHQNVRPYLIT